MTIPGGKAMQVASIPASPGPLGWRMLAAASGGTEVCDHVPSTFASFLRGFAAAFFPARDPVSVPLYPGCPAGPRIHAVPAGSLAAG